MTVCTHRAGCQPASAPPPTARSGGACVPKPAHLPRVCQRLQWHCIRACGRRPARVCRAQKRARGRGALRGAARRSEAGSCAGPVSSAAVTPAPVAPASDGGGGRTFLPPGAGPPPAMAAAAAAAVCTAAGVSYVVRRAHSFASLVLDCGMRRMRRHSRSSRGRPGDVRVQQQGSQLCHCELRRHAKPRPSPFIASPQAPTAVHSYLFNICADQRSR